MVERARSGIRFALDVLAASAREFSYVRANRMAAAIAYRAFFSLAPLLFVAVGVFGAVVGDDAQAQREILDAIERLAGSQVADAMSGFLVSTFEVGDAAAVVGLVLVMWTASSLFLEMQHDLDDIFGVPYERTAGVVGFIKKRGIGFLWTLGLGLVFVGIWVLNFSWRFLGGLFPANAAAGHTVIGILAPVVSVVILPLLFGLILQTMSSTTVPWRAVRYGAAFTSLLFLLAAYGIGVYFAWNTTPSAFTIAGSVFVVLLLVFVLSSAFLFGAQVTKVYADFLERGDVLRPSERSTEGASAAESAPVPTSAVLAFLGGLFVGRRRSK